MYRKRSNNINIPLKVSGNPALVSEEWVFHTGLRVQANSLRGREGRGKLPGRSRSGHCVRVFKVNMMDGD